MMTIEDFYDKIALKKLIFQQRKSLFKINNEVGVIIFEDGIDDVSEEIGVIQLPCGHKVGQEGILLHIKA